MSTTFTDHESREREAIGGTDPEISCGRHRRKGTAEHENTRGNLLR